MIMILSSTPLVSRLERFHCSIYIDLHTYIDSLYNYVGIYSVTEILCVCVCQISLSWLAPSITVTRVMATHY